ncbi:ethanolamine utilization protein EutJ [Siminovitchia terrae]|uniref:Branched-chain amino acid ABC transporter substrate-binding protein n=1 Tax=Siminovitchia terrae TaxID=1914933 RepID=A0A429X6Q2_SIMTE|nr:ABC transporter substrate-binding protein [Siminovitchia terrae]RST59042.1 branched-chain amino acid ABC transporter substrate-binding protein [Siminovitchia terrae]GIN92326.1 ethanolamine utilization protein EutJ [Siminovitchia terrae]GIN96639.1 ethanolamine utilization protein EutJ [Siminovitchia terrae]
MSLKRTFLFVALFSAFLLAACGGGSSTSKESENNDKGSDQPIEAKVGVIAWMTGSGASYGEAITNGLKLANEELSEKGEVKIDLLVEDSAGAQDQALSAAQKLMNNENVSAIIGPTLSTEMNVVGPEADLNGIPIMGTSTTAEGIPQIGEYVFRDSIPEAVAIPASVKKAVDEYGAKKVALIYGNDDVFTKSGYDTMKKTVEDMGLEVVTTETFQIGQSDYKAQLTKIKNLKPDIVLASALYNEGAVILDQARKMGIDVPFVGGNGFNSPEIINIAGDAANGLIVATPWFSEKDNEKVQNFVKKYNDAYGKDPDQFAAQAYDGLYLMAEAIKTAGGDDSDDIRDGLAEIKDFEGVLGTMSFDKDGDIVMEPTVLIVEDGKFKEFE